MPGPFHRIYLPKIPWGMVHVPDGRLGAATPTRTYNYDLAYMSLEGRVPPRPYLEGGFARASSGSVNLCSSLTKRRNCLQYCAWLCLRPMMVFTCK